MQTRKFLSETSQKRFWGEHWSENQFFGGNFRARKVLFFWGVFEPRKPVFGRQFAPRKVLYVTIYIAIYDGIIPIYVQESEK